MEDAKQTSIAINNLEALESAKLVKHNPILEESIRQLIEEKGLR